MRSFKLSTIAIFSTVTAEDTCHLPLDVMFLQDTTMSFDDDLPNVVSQLPDMVARILEGHPSSRFGVAEFKDKPYLPWGEEGSFCYKLGNGALSDDVDRFNAAYARLYASGGGDLEEGQYHALINVALDPLVGWRPLAAQATDATNGQAGARLVIMSTDAKPHLQNDYVKVDSIGYPDLPRNLPRSSASIVNSDVDYSCLKEDYPSPEDVQKVLEQQNIYLAILTPNENAEVTGAWHWVNEDLLGQPAEFYQYVTSDSSNLIDGVMKAIDSVTSYACSITTPAPDEDMGTVNDVVAEEPMIEVLTLKFDTFPEIASLPHISTSAEGVDTNIVALAEAPAEKLASETAHPCDAPCVVPPGCYPPWPVPIILPGMIPVPTGMEAADI